MYRRLLQVIATTLLLFSLYVLSQSMSFVAEGDYLGATLLAVVGVALLRGALELTRATLDKS